MFPYTISQLNLISVINIKKNCEKETKKMMGKALFLQHIVRYLISLSSSNFILSVFPCTYPCFPVFHPITDYDSTTETFLDEKPMERFIFAITSGCLYVLCRTIYTAEINSMKKEFLCF